MVLLGKVVIIRNVWDMCRHLNWIASYLAEGPHVQILSNVLWSQFVNFLIIILYIFFANLKYFCVWQLHRHRMIQSLGKWKPPELSPVPLWISSRSSWQYCLERVSIQLSEIVFRRICIYVDFGIGVWYDGVNHLSVVLSAKAREYVLPALVCLSVCVCVCLWPR